MDRHADQLTNRQTGILPERLQAVLNSLNTPVLVNAQAHTQTYMCTQILQILILCICIQLVLLHLSHVLQVKVKNHLFDNGLVLRRRMILTNITRRLNRRRCQLGVK